MFMSVCIFAWIVCAMALSFLDWKICAVWEPSIITKICAWCTFTHEKHCALLALQALIDGPCSGVLRRDVNFKALHLTKFTIKIGPSARTGTVRKKWEADEITKKWQETTWAKKIAARERVRSLFQPIRMILFTFSKSRFVFLSVTRDFNSLDAETVSAKLVWNATVIPGPVLARCCFPLFYSSVCLHFASHWVKVDGMKKKMTVFFCFFQLE